jgi:signal transduction histidine kinase
MSDPRRPSAFRLNAVALIGASFVIAVLPVALIAMVNRVPASVAQSAVVLTGPWKAIESLAPGLEQPGVDDSTWGEMTLPGPLSASLGLDYRGVLRRSFEWPKPVREGEHYFLNFGNFRNGVAELFVNGVSLGQSASTADGFQTDWAAIMGWEVPSHLVRQGTNQLALRTRNGSGVVDSRILFGPARELRRFNAQIRGATALFSYGAIFLCTFLGALILALIPSAHLLEDKQRFRAVFGLTAAAAVYNASVTGAPWLFWNLPAWSYTLLAFGSMALLSVAMVLFVERRFLGRTTRLFSAHLLISLALTIAGQVWDIVLGVELVYFGVIGGYTGVVALRALWRDPTGSVPLTAFAYVAVIVVGISDILGNLGLSSLPGLMPQAVTDLAIIASATVIAEFIQISRRNQTLSASLAVTNSDLSAALSSAQEATRLKTELLATVSHELRTPLNSIINVPEGLLEDFENTADQLVYVGEPARTTRYLTVIRDSGRHLLSIVDDLLDYSKLNASRFVLSLEPVSLPEFLESLKNTVEPLTRAQQLELDFPQALARPLRADPLRLRQILLNLLSNAVKFSKPGGKVSLRVEDAGEDCVFRVIDQGIGIAKEHHRLIFESFRQVDGSHTRRFGGTGLGLSIAKELVSLHGGSLGVESTPEVGSTFTVRLPFAGPAAPSESRAPSPAVIGAAQRTVLIVEDDLLTLETIKLALAPLGVALVGSTDALTARRLISELKPDVVVLDVMLGGMSGLDLLRELRAAPATVALRAVVTSAAHDNRASALELDAEWVPKPWSGAALHDAVARQFRPSC